MATPIYSEENRGYIVETNKGRFLAPAEQKFLDLNVVILAAIDGQGSPTVTPSKKQKKNGIREPITGGAYFPKLAKWMRDQ
jgi:hypothetical protein